MFYKTNFVSYDSICSLHAGIAGYVLSLHSMVDKVLSMV